MAVLNAAKGRWSINPEERIGLRLRAAFQLLERLKDDSELRCRHVKSHSGILGNELVDAVANAIRNGDLQPRPPPRHYATWMHGDPPQILRAHSLLDHYFRRDLPPIHGDAWIYEAPTVPSTSPCWLQTGEPVPHEHMFCMKIASYNTNTLRHVGAVATLRQQCQQHGLHVIGLQETRTPDATTFDTGYVRYIGAAQNGHGGVELWISTTLSFTGRQREADFFKRTDATVLHAEAEILIVDAIFGGVPTLCVVAHAPHRGHAKTDTEAWWTRLTSSTTTTL